MPETNQALTQRYHDAIERLVEKMQQDRTVLAAILYGSLSYDEVWQRSDIDMWLIMQDGKKLRKNDLCLTENEVIIHANLIPRSRFKRQLEGDRAGGWFDFTFARSTLLFTRDESIRAWYESAERIGARDLEIQLLRAANSTLPVFAKAEKWCHLKKDYHYSFLWLNFAVDRLAAIETLLHGEAPGREVIYQGIKYNPQFFNAIYTELMDKKKTKRSIEAALKRVDQYLCDKAELLFKPLLEYLEEADGMRTMGEIDEHFSKVGIGGLDFACEWLVEKGLIDKLSAPIHLTEKSRIQMDEPAYYLDSEGAIF